MSHPTLPDQIRAAAAGKTPANPEHMHSWLSEFALLKAVEYYGMRGIPLADVRTRFASRNDELRRKMLRELADALGAPTKSELFEVAEFLENGSDYVLNRVAAYLRARAGEIE